MNVSPIIVDIETVGLPNAADFLEPIPDAVPDESPIEADKRLTDPVKITADLNRRALARAEANREAQQKVEQQRLARIQEAALDWNVGQVAALAWWTEETGTQIYFGKDEHSEATALMLFWREARHRTIVGFNVRGFDLKFMVQRSRLLGVQYPQLDFGKYSRKTGITDLYSELTFGDGPYDRGVMRRTLRAFAKRFGIPCTDTVEGKDIPALVAAGEWDTVGAHVRADIETTLALAVKLGVVRHEAAEAVAL